MLAVLPVSEPLFAVHVVSEGGRRVVFLSGELDLATRDAAQRACLCGIRSWVQVDMSATTFMDWAGYGALLAAGRVLRRRGGSLTLRNLSGQPARALALFASVGLDDHALGTLRAVVG